MRTASNHSCLTCKISLKIAIKQEEKKQKRIIHWNWFTEQDIQYGFNTEVTRLKIHRNKFLA